MNSREFLTIWEDWDERPGNEEAALAFEDACKDVAARFGVGVTPLRILLSELRRNGMSRDEAIRELQGRLAESG